MRVLFLKNTAGALTPVVEWLDAHGHECVVVAANKREASHHRKLVNSKFVVASNPVNYYLTVIHYLIHFRPHIIHSNSLVENLVLSRIFRPRTPLIHMYHGSDVRGRRAAHVETRLADRVFVSTPDLRRYGEWLDRVVMDNFYYRGGRVAGTALMLFSPNVLRDLRKEAQAWCEARDLRLTIINRNEKHIDHNKMPDLLSSFEYYIDFKGTGIRGTLSLIALEALQCGCKVVSDADPSVIFTREDYKFTTAKDYLAIYESMRSRKSKLRVGMLLPLLIGILKIILRK